jgi:endonuclease YncB( thermonuclease family)
MTRILAAVIGLSLGIVLARCDYQQARADPTPIPKRRVELLGTVRVVDGDTIIVGSQHIRLWGIDAPELLQTCPDGFRAGKLAAEYLTMMVTGTTVDCQNMGIDKYSRIIGRCRTGHPTGGDLGSVLVESGYAWAYRQYSLDYAAIEDEARRNRRGVWAHNCIPAWDWRRKK